MTALSLDNLARLERRWPPADTTVIDRAGLPVDVSGSVWRLNSPIRAMRLNWSLVHTHDGAILDGFKCFIVNEIRTASSSSVFNAFNNCMHLLHTPAAMKASLTGNILPYLAFSQAREQLGEDGWQLHYGRMMYHWCRTQLFDQFCPDVDSKIRKMNIGGNAKGRAVRSRDPNKGPLTAEEVANIMSALRAGRAAGTIPIEEQAALVLCLATGSNPGQYVSMREEDLQPVKADGQTVSYILHVPRHKKGHEHLRADFRARKLNTYMGGIIEDLCSSNRANPHSGDNVSRPLFRKEKSSDSRGNVTEEWLHHCTSPDFTNLLQRAIERLGVKSRNGEPLRVTTRRFRYTFASRMVNNGASKAALADALDHSDLQHVGVYWEIHSDIVDHLDRALSLALAPRAQAFAGIVKSEAEAVRGGEKGSRRYLTDAGSRRFEPIGTCGSHSFCNITAPYACYTCVKFQAWMDGPHEDVLSQLLTAREQRSRQNLDAKIVGIEDQLIMAVAGVITRIETMRVEQESSDE